MERVRGGWYTPWGSSVSLGVAELIGVRSGCRRVRSVSLGSLGYVVVVVAFVRGLWIHWGVHWISSGSFGVAPLI